MLKQWFNFKFTSHDLAPDFDWLIQIPQSIVVLNNNWNACGKPRAHMATKNVHKLHAVTLIRSQIGRNNRQKQALGCLGLKKVQQTVIHKNTTTINGYIRIVSDMVKVQPIRVRYDIENSPKGDGFLAANGDFFTNDRTIND